jgi:hypothetical protein
MAFSKAKLRAMFIKLHLVPVHYGQEISQITVAWTAFSVDFIEIHIN